MPVENTTTNNAFRYPTSGNNGPNFAQGVADLAADVDAMDLSGTLVGRPAASKLNRTYYATDTGQFFKDTGSAWQQLTEYLSGTDASKPAASAAVGQFYLATDSNTLYVSDGTVWRMVYGSRGSAIIATSEVRTNTAYGLMPTPDQVANLVVPTTGLIEVLYQATWQESVAGAARAAIFIGANQIKVQGYDGTSGGTHTQAAATISPTAAVNVPLTTHATGLGSGQSTVNYGADVSTGQAVGFATSVSTAGLNQEIGTTTCGATTSSGGACFVFVAAGTYSVSIQFKASSGSVTASNRRLWASVVPFS